MTNDAYRFLLQQTCSHPYSGQRHMCPLCGTVHGARRVVQLTSASGTYREWDVTIAGTQYGIVCEGDTWTLLVYVPTCLAWCDVPGMDVDTFLATHKLILAA